MSQSKQKFQDFLAPLLSSEDKGIGASGDLAKTKDMRAYMYSLPTVAYLGESTHKTGDPMNEKMARLDNTLHIIDGHAERMFSGMVGRRYMVKQGSNVGFIPAAYVEGASGGATPAPPSASTTPSTPSTPSIPSTSSTPAAPVRGCPDEPEAQRQRPAAGQHRDLQHRRLQLLQAPHHSGSFEQHRLGVQREL